MQSVDRIVTILTQLANSQKGLGITDLYGVCDLPKSTLHRTLNSLGEFGFVIQDGQTKKYRLGAALLRLGTRFLAQNDLRVVARPFIEDLGAALNETVYITILQEDTAICLDTFGASRDLYYFVRIGREMPINTTAAAKVILAYQPEAVIRRIVVAKRMVKLTAKSITDPEQLVEQLSLIREQGYSICEEEMEEGITAISAPIWDWSSQVAGSLALIGPCMRLAGENRPEIIAQVKRTAQLISAELGYEENNQFSPALDRIIKKESNIFVK